MAQTGDRRRTPMPHRETEMRSSGNGPITTYTLSPDELAKYGPVKPYTGPEKKPIQNLVRAKVDLSSEEQRRRALVRHENREEQNEMSNRGPAPKEVPSCGLTKQIYIEQIAGGETNASLERAWNMKANSLYMWINRWELKGLTPDKAQQLLVPSASTDGTVNNPPSATSEPTTPSVTEEVKLLREKDFEPGHVQLEMDKLKLLLRDTVEANNRKDAEIERLTKRMVEAQSEATKAWSEVERLREESENMKSIYGTATEAHARDRLKMQETIDNLVRERLAAFEADKRFDSIQEAHDPVNHPSHYNVGGIECIDAIEAATTGLTGGQAYNTGAALKYLWRWARKNGVEDLQKARWYIDRLIEAEQRATDQTTDRERTG